MCACFYFIYASLNFIKFDDLTILWVCRDLIFPLANSKTIWHQTLTILTYSTTNHNFLVTFSLLLLVHWLHFFDTKLFYNFQSFFCSFSVNWAQYKPPFTIFVLPTKSLPGKNPKKKSLIFTRPHESEKMLVNVRANRFSFVLTQENWAKDWFDCTHENQLMWLSIRINCFPIRWRKISSLSLSC